MPVLAISQVKLDEVSCSLWQERADFIPLSGHFMDIEGRGPSLPDGEIPTLTYNASW